MAEISQDLIKRLLREEEGSCLDFKRDQYPLSKASEDEQSKLLKDILAFANAWRRSDAFIVIGVEEVKVETTDWWGYQTTLMTRVFNNL